MFEHEMVDDCYAFFRDIIGFKHIALEIPFLGRCIDMVLINENDVIFTIEFKVNNIRQAIKQAKDHVLGADYAYICIPESKKVNIELLKSENIGLYLYNPAVENKARPVYHPNLNKKKVKAFSDMLLKTTMEVLDKAAKIEKENER